MTRLHRPQRSTRFHRGLLARMHPDPFAQATREAQPVTAVELWHWVWHHTGVRIATARVCRAHSAPFDWFARQWLDRPPLILIQGARGSGKSFLQAILTHLESRFLPGLGTRILGGSKAQSLQIYEALERAVRDGCGPFGSDAAALARLLKTDAYYRNGSHVSILAASPTAVRGPHVASLRLDEVDEIDDEIREAAMGMAMSLRGTSSAVSLTSTWHRLSGPMARLLDQAKDGRFPHHTTCVFDVLERCPESRSGPYVGGVAAYANCPACPIVAWCHSERDRNGGHPLAKLSDGHYAIDSLIQKTVTNSTRVFESDYLCRGPRADGAWFPAFDGRNVSAAAEYDPRLPVHLAIDSGVFTGAVAFQAQQDGRGGSRIGVFFDYLAEGLSAEANARAVAAALGDRRGTKFRVSTDPAGGARNAVGPTVLAEYLRCGLRGSNGDIERWPSGSVADGLALIEGLIRAADGSVGLIIHPRCERLKAALEAYRRAKRGGQWQDYPEDPQHPAEDLVDALRGGLRVEFPEGRRPAPALRKVVASRFF